MTHLAYKELLALSEMTASLYEADGSVQFGERLVTQLSRLIGGDIYSYNEVDSRTKRSIAQWAPSSVAMIPDGLEILGRHADENPIVPYFKRTGDGRAMMISDFLTQREFRERPLYQDFYKPFRIPYHLAIALSIQGSSTITTIVHRGRREFNERDRLLLNLARPHLLQAYRQSQLRATFQHQLRSQQIALDSLNMGLLAATPKGRITWMTERCGRVLQHWGLAPCRGRLPGTLFEWARADDACRARLDQSAEAPIPFVRTDARGTLRITKLVTAPPWMFVVEATALTSSSEVLSVLGLSKRETEILSWVARGKTNPEIGAILGISPRTVHKHLGRIYVRLGVENRHAAMALVMETVRRGYSGNSQG